MDGHPSDPFSNIEIWGTGGTESVGIRSGQPLTHKLCLKVCGSTHRVSVFEYRGGIGHYTALCRAVFRALIMGGWVVVG